MSDSFRLLFLFILFFLIPTSLLLFISFFLPGEAIANGQQSYVEGEVIVKLKDRSTEQETHTFLGKAQASRGMSLKASFPQMQMYHYALRKGQTVEQMVQDLTEDPNVEYAEPNYLLYKANLPAGIQTMSVEDMEILAEERSNLATDAAINPIQHSSLETFGVTSRDSSSVPKPRVAIIDTGLDPNHPVFVDSEALWVNEGEIPDNNIDDDGNGYKDDMYGWNFVDNSGTIYDDDGHGTHVAGIILGVTQDIFIEPFEEAKIEIMALKFLNADGVGSTSDAIKAIHYAVENGAHILNNSWGGGSYSTALHEAVAYTYKKGLVFVAAAGNSGKNNDDEPTYPASYDVPHIMSIAATTSQDGLASFSNFGTGSVDMGSPGVLILSTIPDERYGLSSGTSMAAPFVSGVAALALRKSPEMLGYQVKSIIFQASDPINALVSKVSQESRVNVASVVNLAQDATVETSQPHYSFSAAERELASILGNASCGRVTYFRSQGGGPSMQNPHHGGRALVFFGIMLIPILVIYGLRRRQFKGQGERKHERLHLESEVKVAIGDSHLVGSISSASLGGVQLNTEAMLEQGGIVTMKITSPDGKEQVEVQGQVVWRKEKEAYGVQFAQPQKAAFAWISSCSHQPK